MKTLLLTLLTVFLLWGGGFGVFVLTSMIEPSAIPETDAIVVFTGGPGRVEKGLELFRKDGIKYVFISGVHPDVRISELPGADSLPACCLRLGKSATTTLENAQETKEWIEDNDIGSVLLITSEYHLHRSALELSAAVPGLKVSTYAVREYLPHQTRLGLFFEEYHKVLYRWAQIMREKLTGTESRE